AEIAKLTERKREIMSDPKSHSYNSRLIELGEINKRLNQLSSEAPAPVAKRARLVDPTLLQKRDGLKQQMRDVKELYARDSRRNDLLLQFDGLSQQLQRLERQIAGQQ